MTKAFGKDINEFYNNHFPEGWFTEGEDVDFQSIEDKQGRLILSPTEKYELKDFGYLVPEHADQGKEMTFESAFKKWQKSKTHTSVLIEIPIDQAGLVAELLKMSFPEAKVIK